MVIGIRTIPHSNQKYETVGNWGYLGDGTLWIEVSDLDDPRHELLVAVHELVESQLCKHRGVTEDEVTQFDMAYERTRKNKEAPCGCKHLTEPGDDKHAPYYKEHQEATSIERSFATMLGVDWNEYDRSTEDPNG